MLKNYFKVAWRNIFRNKGFSTVNLLGLTIGMSCTLLILLWVQDEISYNKFHNNYDETYQVIANRDFKNEIFTDRNMVLPLASALKASYPDIRRAVVTTYSGPHTISRNTTLLTKNGITVSDGFFELFTWKFLQGSAKDILKDPGNIILTKSAATALFGNEDPLNKVIKIDDNRNLKVAAILADPPGNSTFQYDFVMPFDYSNERIKRSMSEWTNSSWNVFIQPQPGVSIAKVTKEVNDLKKQHDPNDKISSYFLFPMKNWRLYSEFKDGKNTGGMIEFVRLFSAIAAIILLIACVNFMNLSTARSEKRAREVGIRKTLGSEKKDLILQFFMESLILALIAFVISMIAVFLLLPSFNLLVAKKLSLHIYQPAFWLGAFLIVALTGLIAGSYPALYLSSFNPVKVLKGSFLPGKKAERPRQILVVAQFMISIILISATLIVYRQIEFIRDRSIGYNPNNLIEVTSSETIDKNYQVIRNELLSSGVIESVNRSGNTITSTQWRSGSPDYDGKPADVNIIFSAMSTDVDLARTMGIKMVAGHDFRGVPADSSSVVINQEAARVMNLKNPLGMELRYGKDKFHIIGVTENFVVESPFEPVPPRMLFYNAYFSQVINVRLKAGASPSGALAAMESIFKKYNLAFPFEYRFLDQEFGKKFVTENLTSRITNIFAGLAVFICCIGLAGLVSFTIEKRTREIGIRKVLGATVRQVLSLISVDFLRLVFIAYAIAIPIAWWLMHRWLEKYTFHTTIDIWLFVAVGFTILCLTALVVTLNTIRAAMNNPVKSLRSE